MDSPVINTENGKIKGLKLKDFKDNSYYSFYGIPYAKPPVGELRFRAPQPPELWEGIRDGTKQQEGCYARHMLNFSMTGSEDCLYLNVYTREIPKETVSKLKPVMVWIHGGAFSTGNGKTELYGPDFLMPEDIVVVTPNYRVGPLGFMCFEDVSLGVPGNAGLKDVLMALKWVNKNIKNFGGDPENVTLAGVSSGGVITHCMMLTPLAKGLFHKAIIQSATAIHSWTFSAKSDGKKLAKICGCESEDEKEILDFLTKLPVKDLLKGRDKMKNTIYPDERRTFSPVIETPIPNEMSIITEEPMKIILSGEYNKVPMLMGYVSSEGQFFEPILKGKEFLVPSFEKMVPHPLNLTKGSDRSLFTADKIKKFYFGDKECTQEEKPSYYEMVSDIFFAYHLQTALRLHSKSLGHPLYFYKFSIDLGLNIYKKLNQAVLPGACHCDDVCYLFKMDLTPEIQHGSKEEITIHRMTKFWANFIKSADPNPKDNDPLIKVEWKPVDKERLNYLDINVDLTPGVAPDEKRIAFWDEIYQMDSALKHHKM
ncbi:esterase B1-like [Onthophagus taurus]|uniref:esterase B1-like n=1 Tax=Onthophagus taurus TaxID=166361 RepID=UPI0039BE9BEA